MQELKSIDFLKQLAPLQINLIFLSISMFSVYDENLPIANSPSSVSLQKMKRRSAGLICRCFLSFGVSVVILMMKETRLRRQIRSKMYAFEADFKKHVATSEPAVRLLVRLPSSSSSSSSSSLLLTLAFRQRRREYAQLFSWLHTCSHCTCSVLELVHTGTVAFPFRKQTSKRVFFFFWNHLLTVTKFRYVVCVFFFKEKTRQNSVVWDDDAAHQNAVSH